MTVAVAAYVPVILLLRSWMSERPAFDLVPLNCSAASLVSLVGFVLTLGYGDVGFEALYTSMETQTRGRYGAVLFVCGLSMIVELFDTAFIVLRKKHLHHPVHVVFHHYMVLIYGWCCLHTPLATGYWFAQTSMCVHAIMHAHFAFATELGGGVPPWFNPLILTVLQIVQMVWGLTISILYLLHPATRYDRDTLCHVACVLAMSVAYVYLCGRWLEAKYRFETRVNWGMCAYLLGTHVLGLSGAIRCGSWRTFGEVLLWYQVSAFGVTIGCHRLWSHRSFQARAPTRFVLMLLASMANQGGIYHWSRDHRVHHKESDHAGDPHDSSRGFFYAHMGWLMLRKSTAVKLSGQSIDCSDLLRDPIVWLQYRLNPLWDQVWCFVVPGFYGLWRMGSFWDGLLIFGALRWVLVVHATWCVNSVSHFFGYRPYNNRPPTENWLTAIVANGEGWHNFHHAFPYDYTTAGQKWWYRLNTSSMVIDCTWLLGQTYAHKQRRTVHTADQ